jgi:iron complex outermembrane receptor protein
MMHTRVISQFVVFMACAASVAAAQGARRARADSVTTRRDTLESVVVRATRAPVAPAAARATVTRAELQRTAAGQDAPLVLSTTPAVTVYSEAGGYSGYSYIRLRGIDQTRLNITVDGVPLNDPEDQVLYFSNVPDFLGSMQGVEVGRGVGASTFGTASFAGSLNFQSVPLAATPRGAQVELSGGSFGTWRSSVQGATGLSSRGFASYGRFTRQGTSGYRDHSGNDSWSAFGSTGWFGAADALKLTAFAGNSGTRLAYLAASEAELKANPRTNPLSDQEGDRFHQEMVSAQYSHAFSDRLTATAMAYRNSAAGAYDVSFGPAPGGGLSIANYGLGHVWYGSTAALTWSGRDLSVAAGVTATDYHRDHWMAMRPALASREYTNTGVKRETAAFAKLAWESGAWRVAVDLNLRHAAFRYRPSAGDALGPQEVSWSFANPRVGVTYAAAPAWSLFVTAGRTLREPARGDLFAGADDLNASNAAGLLPLTRVKPEELNDYEAGATWKGASAAVTVNAFAMEFRNEIAAIGALSQTGNPLRKNVPGSWRRGVEVDGTLRTLQAGTWTGNLTAMQARIAEYADANAGRTYRDVEPVMTPPVIANLRWDATPRGGWAPFVTGRYVDRAHLANDGNAALVTPAYTMVGAGVQWARGRHDVRLTVENALDARAYAGGYTDGTSRYFYPIAARSVLFTWRAELGGR